ncbi:Uncharacterized protein Rs2_12305 [Raphanus sativus]|nr:Uncharacterized protein Rs2_12305 [Raphanus sativus]
MNKWHGLKTSLRRVLQGFKVAVPEKALVSFLWERAVCALSVRRNADENIDGLLGLDEKGGGALSVEDYMKKFESLYELGDKKSETGYDIRQQILTKHSTLGAIRPWTGEKKHSLHTKQLCYFFPFWIIEID